MSQLSDTQLVLLAAAAQRADGSVLPPPHTLTDNAARLTRTFRALLKQALVSEAPASDPTRTWRQDGETAVGIFITDAGRVAIGGEPANTTEEPAPILADEPSAAADGKAAPKITQVLALLQRDEGATLAELVAVTGWLPHTTRAALTRLRQKGHVLHKGKRGELTRYAIVDAA